MNKQKYDIFTVPTNFTDNWDVRQILAQNVTAHIVVSSRMGRNTVNRFT
jgi:hypothetical protein